MKFDNEKWQGAIMLPKERMCDYHRALFDTMPFDIQQAREALVGKRIEVQPLNGNVLDPEDNSTPLPKKFCIPLVGMRQDGSVAGMFSCEVSTD
jgi:hypothetical protein